MQARPTLLNSCASAATAAEARYRIDAAPHPPRSTRVVALDAGASLMARELAQESWPGARFLDLAGSPDPQEFDDLVLDAAGGERVRLSEELVDADFVMMIATAGDGAAAASTIGTACTLRGIMTAAVVLGPSGAADGALAALRPHARVLLVSEDWQDVAEVLSAVGT